MAKKKTKGGRVEFRPKPAPPKVESDLERIERLGEARWPAGNQEPEEDEPRFRRPPEHFSFLRWDVGPDCWQDLEWLPADYYTRALAEIDAAVAEALGWKIIRDADDGFPLYFLGTEGVQEGLPPFSRSWDWAIWAAHSLGFGHARPLVLQPGETPATFCATLLRRES